jgi:adenine nucleotide transporter 17
MSISADKKSVFSTIKDIYKSEGIQAFYKGVIPNLVLVINPIINFVIYEGLKKFLLRGKFSLNAA